LAGRRAIAPKSNQIIRWRTECIWSKVPVPSLIYKFEGGTRRGRDERLGWNAGTRVFTEVIDKEGDTQPIGLEGSVLTN